MYVIMYWQAGSCRWLDTPHHARHKAELCLDLMQCIYSAAMERRPLIGSICSRSRSSPAVRSSAAGTRSVSSAVTWSTARPR